MYCSLPCHLSDEAVADRHAAPVPCLMQRDAADGFDAAPAMKAAPILTRRGQAFCSVVVSMLLIGCGTSKNDFSTDVTKTDTLHTEVERGPIRVTVDVSPKEPRLSDEPKLTLTITVADGVKVEAPPFGESLGEFVIRDFHEPIPRRSAGYRILQQIYTLEPTHAGPLLVAPVSVRFTDDRANGDGKEHKVETEAMTLNVATIIPSEAPSLNDLRPPAPPVELPEAGMSSVWLWTVCGIILFVVGCILVRRRKVGASAEPQLSPQDLANRELRELISRKLSETDVKAFFVELTGVVRRYIERSTGVRAPEQTTEEFLREVNADSLFPQETNARLGAFLESADLVKFAGYHPDAEAIKQSTHRAKQFIELKANAETLPDDIEAPASDSSGSQEAAESQEKAV
jgi:hypothetical protein